MKKYERVNNNIYFNEIIRTSPFVKNANFVIYYKKTSNYNYHVGIAVGKKIGKAHLRNKLKRIVRNICEENRFIFKNNTDYIIMVKKECINSDYQTLTKNLISAFNKIGE